MRASKVLSRIRAGHVARICCSSLPIPYFPRLASHFGYDGVWIDAEHRNWDPRQVETTLLYHQHSDIDCIWRPSVTEKGALYRLLEDGATGLMIPMVNTADRARELVSAVKFPPIGERGLDGSGIDGGFYVGMGNDYTAAANRETFLIAQIETPQALDEVDAIASVRGVDILLIGPGDLSLRLGCSPSVSDPLMLDAERKVADAARRHGKAWGRPVGDADSARAIVELGAQFLVHGTDFAALHSHLQKCATELDALLGTTAPIERASSSVAVP